jgi:N-acetylglucosamine kinase
MAQWLNGSMAQYVLGLDGGGSKTECVLARDDGAVLGRGRGGGVNRNFVTEAAFEKAVHEAIHQATRAAPEVAHIAQVAGSMSCDGASMRRFARRFRIDRRHIRWVGEAATARAASEVAFRRAPDIVVVAGTGSLVAGWQSDGQQRSVGGCGSTIGDEGSAYWIGVRALRRLAESFDGRQPFDAFAAGMCEALAAPNLGVLVNRVYGGGQRPMTRDQLAAVAPHVSRLAEAGDPVARAIFRDAAAELAFQVGAMARILGLAERAFTVLLYGGVFRAGAPVVEPLQCQVLAGAPGAEFLPPLKCTAIGAAALALKALDVDPAQGMARDNLLAGGRRFDLL